MAWPCRQRSPAIGAAVDESGDCGRKFPDAQYSEQEQQGSQQEVVAGAFDPNRGRVLRSLSGCVVGARKLGFGRHRIRNGYAFAIQFLSLPVLLLEPLLRNGVWLRLRRIDLGKNGIIGPARLNAAKA